MHTNVPHIWAAGDVTGGLQFTHVAYEQGKIAAHNAFSAEPQTFEHLVIPWVTFTDPALAHVGKTEEQLKKEGVSYRTGCMYFKDVERAISEGETNGFVKLLVDEKGCILGGHILASACRRSHCSHSPRYAGGFTCRETGQYYHALSYPG